jgi:hypothetical protein
MLTCLQALGMYPVTRKVLICICFWYVTDFDTLRMSCQSFFCNSFGFQCVEHPKVIWAMHFKCPQQWRVLQLWLMWHTERIFKSCMLQHPGSAKISGYELLLCHFSDT